MKSINCSSRLCPVNMDYYSFPLDLFFIFPYNPVAGNKKKQISEMLKIYNLYINTIIFHSLDINTIILVRNILSCVQHAKDDICSPPPSQLLLQTPVYTYIHTHTQALTRTLSNTQTHALAYQLSQSVTVSLWTFKERFSNYTY